MVLAAGRVGSTGGSSRSGLLELLGGLLNGDLSNSILCDIRLLGFSARFTGGGSADCALTSRSLRISTDRRGGGGDGGCEAASLGDRRGSMIGVCGRLGILKDRGDGAVGVMGDTLVGSTLS